MDGRMPDQVWAHPSVSVGPSAIEGRGLVAAKDHAPGTVLLRLAGSVVTTERLDALIHEATLDPSLPYVDTLAVAEDQHLVLPPGTIAHFGNHSCDPNMWHLSTYEIGARRAIRSGDELTIDYATQAGAAGLSMPCQCGSALCRGVITSDDWRIPELQAAYKGHWVEPLERRIEATSDR